MDLAGGIIRSSTVARSSRWRVRLTSAPQPARASWGASHGFAGWRAEVWAAFWRNAAPLSGTPAYFGPESFRFCCGKVWVLSFIVPDLFVEASLIPLGYLVHFWLLGLLPPRGTLIVDTHTGTSCTVPSRTYNCVLYMRGVTPC